MAFVPPGTSKGGAKEQAALEAKEVVAYRTMLITEGNSISHKESIALAANKEYVCTDWTEAIIQIKA